MFTGAEENLPKQQKDASINAFIPNKIGRNEMHLTMGRVDHRAYDCTRFSWWLPPTEQRTMDRAFSTPTCVHTKRITHNNRWEVEETLVCAAFGKYSSVTLSTDVKGVSDQLSFTTLIFCYTFFSVLAVHSSFFSLLFWVSDFGTRTHTTRSIFSQTRRLTVRLSKTKKKRRKFWLLSILCLVCVSREKFLKYWKKRKKI